MIDYDLFLLKIMNCSSIYSLNFLYERYYLKNYMHYTFSQQVVIRSTFILAYSYLRLSISCDSLILALGND